MSLSGLGKAFIKATPDYQPISSMIGIANL